MKIDAVIDPGAAVACRAKPVVSWKRATHPRGSRRRTARRACAEAAAPSTSARPARAGTELGDRSGPRPRGIDPDESDAAGGGVSRASLAGSSKTRSPRRRRRPRTRGHDRTSDQPERVDRLCGGVLEDRFRLGVQVERLDRLLASVAGLLDAAERDAREGDERRVDPDAPERMRWATRWPRLRRRSRRWPPARSECRWRTRSPPTRRRSGSVSRRGRPPPPARSATVVDAADDRGATKPARPARRRREVGRPPGSFAPSSRPIATEPRTLSAWAALISEPPWSPSATDRHRQRLGALSEGRSNASYTSVLDEDPRDHTSHELARGVIDRPSASRGRQRRGRRRGEDDLRALEARFERGPLQRGPGRRCSDSTGRSPSHR